QHSRRESGSATRVRGRLQGVCLSSSGRGGIHTDAAPFLSGSQQLLVLYHHAPVLHHLDSLARQRLGHSPVANPRLHPHRGWSRSEYVIQVRREIRRTAENADDVQLPGNIGELPVYLFAEYLRYVRVIHGNGYDFVAGQLHVAWHMVGRLIGFGNLDSQHGNPAALAQEALDVGISLQKSRVPSGMDFGSGHAEAMCQKRTRESYERRCGWWQSVNPCSVLPQPSNLTLQLK